MKVKKISYSILCGSVSNIGLSLLLVSPARQTRHSVRQRWKGPVSPDRRGPSGLGCAGSVGPSSGLIEARSVAGPYVVVSFQCGLAGSSLLLAHGLHLQQNLGSLTDQVVRVSAGNRPKGAVPVQRGSGRGHANAMRPGFRLSLIRLNRRLRLIGPSVQIRQWGGWSRLSFLLFIAVRQSWLRRKLLERNLFSRLR